MSTSQLAALHGPYHTLHPFSGWATQVRLESGAIVSLMAGDLPALREAFHQVLPDTPFDHTLCRRVILGAHALTHVGGYGGDVLGPADDWPLARWWQQGGWQQCEPGYGGGR